MDQIFLIREPFLLFSAKSEKSLKSFKLDALRCFRLIAKIYLNVWTIFFYKELINIDQTTISSDVKQVVF